MRPILEIIATLGPIGFIPVAPGTFGSLAASIFLWLVPLSPRAHIAFIIIGTVLGSHAASLAERQFKEKDSGKIVIDEFIGYMVAAFYIPKNTGYLLAALILFRLFDIFKPIMINKIENALKNGAGVMADDILAGIYTNALLQLFLLLLR
jgi:phosphatidylglycerophosphatase A